MKRTRLSKLLAVFISLMIALQGVMPQVAYAEQRKVAVENHTSITDQAKTVTGITIDGVDKPVAGAGLDDTATVTTAEGDSWEIPVLWVRDDLQIDRDEADEGHTYLPVLAFFVPQGYALADGVFTVTLSDSLTALFGTQETISVFDASTGITYIMPASLRNLFARQAHTDASTASEEGQVDIRQTEAQQEQLQEQLQEQQEDVQEEQKEPVLELGGADTIVEMYCAQTARDVLSDEDLQWLIELIIDYLEPQAVELLLNKFPAFREAANNGEIGKQIGLYIYYDKGDKDGIPEHAGLNSALAYAFADIRKIDGALKWCYMLAVDVKDLIQKDAKNQPIRDSSGHYKLIREGAAMTTLQNTIVHELFHAITDDYNRTGMAGATNIQDRVTDSNNQLPTQALFERYRALRYPQWFIEGTASAVENVYTFRYGLFQIFRRLQDANGRYGAGSLNPTYEPLLTLNNYINAQFRDGTYVYFELEWSNGGTQNNGKPIDTTVCRYVTGYLATLYLSERAALYSHNNDASASAVQTVDGVTTVDSEKLRDGLNSILKWLHEGQTLDQVISKISPKDANGQPIFADTKSFEERFIRGVKQADGKYYANEENESLLFVNTYLNYMLRLDKPLPNDETPNGSILFDFSKRYASPLDPSKKSSSEYLAISNSNSLVPSTVKSDTVNIGGGKSNPDQASASAQVQQANQAAKDDALPIAAKTSGTDESVAAGKDAAGGTSTDGTATEGAAASGGASNATANDAASEGAVATAATTGEAADVSADGATTGDAAAGDAASGDAATTGEAADAPVDYAAPTAITERAASEVSETNAADPGSANTTGEAAANVNTTQGVEVANVPAPAASEPAASAEKQGA